MEVHGWAGFGADGKPDFWIHEGINTKPRIHVVFRSKNREKVRGFCEAAIKAGGGDNGAPSIREMYHPNNYGAESIKGVKTFRCSIPWGGTKSVSSNKLNGALFLRQRLSMVLSLFIPSKL
jgi:hypothetical protein